MNANVPTVSEDNFIRSLFGSSRLVLNSVEARLFVLALSSLSQESQALTFQMSFNDVIPGGYAGGQQYAELEEAQARLTRPINKTTIRQGKRISQYFALFSVLSLDEDTGLITGEFNPEMKAHWLELAGAFTAFELESLLLLR